MKKKDKRTKKLGLQGEVLRRLNAQPLSREQLNQVNGGDDGAHISCMLRWCTWSESSM